jgi:hypothetical protein
MQSRLRTAGGSLFAPDKDLFIGVHHRDAVLLKVLPAAADVDGSDEGEQRENSLSGGQQTHPTSE